MAQIRRRVAETGAASDALFQPAPGPGDTAPLAEARLERAEDAGLIVPLLTAGPSTRPIVGPLIGRIKSFVVRANTGSVASLATQQTRFNAEILGYSRMLGTEVAQLRQALPGGGDTAERLAAIERRLGRIESLLDDRSARAGDGTHEST